MNRTALTEGLLKAVDDMDTDGFAGFLADDVSFRFGNADTVHGKAATREAVAGFFASVKSLHHELERVWDQEDAVICQGMVTYTRHDSTALKVPFVNVLILENDRIGEYLIYVDASQLYSAS